jgi:hypothetical protein
MESRIFRPPVVAVWLVGFFSPDKQTEAIQGDLVEEFSRLASSSGVATARRWYWRQSINTVTHLIGAGFCAAPWLIAGAVLVGCLSLWFGLGLADLASFHFRALFHFKHDASRISAGHRLVQIQVGRFLLVMLVGSLVALVVKGREMVTAIALSLVCAALCGFAYPAWTLMHNAELALPVRVFQLVSSIAILLGAAIVREIRFIVARQHRSA